ncbi:Stress-response A/B barrel domain-containing protein UP3 [Sesamum angolense]|uniref:Stress-response A/B barrel domain-containing protein UP3 n=1 Tax=Sesamum angolense TaxID=2727404 RepID=A0AAE2BT63_9LAMI|nr:Stress-response A/B barrel domain-containing protein UP3 [Sesamum angolense]
MNHNTLLHFLFQFFCKRIWASLLAATQSPSEYALCETSLIGRKLLNSRSRSSITMSSSIFTSTSDQIIEHVVLYKLKPDADPPAVNAMLSNLHSLASIDSVLHLSAGPVSRCRSNSLTFTHMLHCRYRSKPDLISYSENPKHISVVANYVKPVVDDVMAVDWVANDFSFSPVIPPGSASRLTILKLKEGTGESGKNEVLGRLRGIKQKHPSIEQLTVGENFSPGRAKGFRFARLRFSRD